MLKPNLNVELWLFTFIAEVKGLHVSNVYFCSISLFLSCSTKRDFVSKQTIAVSRTSESINVYLCGQCPNELANLQY